ncbi:cytochrome c oxidase accessory protein CcoG [Bacteroidota bacterium]
MEDIYQVDPEFRDHISTVDAKGKRVWIFPKKPKGRFHTTRIVVAIILLVLLFSGPFIKIDGRPFILLDVFNRHFIIFGTPFWPQDFHLFVLAIITLFLFIILFTVIYGRVWCGWACPQTIFMEMVFRKIEYLIEGDANKQRKLNQMPWNSEKVIKRGTKHLIFFVIAILISHLVMAYLIGIDRVVEIISQPPAEHLAGFMGISLNTFVFYGVFAFMREQVCIAVCPYGRLQGVFLDKKSIAVMFDWVRGEPRGKIRKKEPQPENKGDCIDCKMCVHVCPTGIDIRNGTQLECVNCTACIDACDDIMIRVKKPRGLIRYASHESIKEGKKGLFSVRVAGYSMILVLLVALQVYLLSTRIPVETTILRVPGMLYQEQENDVISNLYNIQFINKTFEDINIELRLRDFDSGNIRRVGESTIHIPANGNIEGVFFIDLPKSFILQAKTPLVLEVIDLKKNEIIEKTKTNFLGPVNIRK